MADGLNIKIKITDNSPEVLDALKRACSRALDDMGATAEGYAKAAAPVDTGRLRNSITHKLASTKQVQIGSNVEYAEAQEMAGPRSHHPHYLRDSIATHVPEYKNILAESLKNA